MKRILMLLVLGLLALTGIAGVSGQEKPVVYFTNDISPDGLMAVYAALGWEPMGKVAVKLSTGGVG